MLALAGPVFADKEVTVSATPSRDAVAPGGHLVIAVEFDHAEEYHTWPHVPVLPPSLKDFDPWPTTIKIDVASAGVNVSDKFIQWPEPKEITTSAVSGSPIKVLSYVGHCVAFVPVTVATDAPAGPASVSLTFSFQTCNQKACLFPADVPLRIEFRIDPAAAASVTEPAVFAGFDQGVWAKVGGAKPPAPPPNLPPETRPPAPASGSGSSPTFDLFGLRFSSTNILAILLIAALGGFILNLTPCVLPVVPLKVMSLQNSAGHHSGKRIALGISMSLGVIAFWFVLGLLIVSLKVFQGTNDLFGNAWFQLCVGLFIGAMALGMLGAFTIQLPQSVYMLNPRQDTLHGSFGFGVMTAILGTPCFGPFAGAAAGWATTQPASVGLATFTSIGIGMALPYLVLAVWPGLLGFVPRTGPASELVKQIMGLLLFAAGVFFLGTGLITLVADRPYLGSVLHWWGVAAFCAMAGVWLIYRTVQITKSPARRGVFALLGLVLAVLGIGWAQWMTRLARETYIPPASAGATAAGLWQPYSPEAVETATKAGKVVVLDFTAVWCLNCKVIEATVLNTDQVKTALGAADVQSFRVDISSTSAPGRAALANLHEVGIPLLAIFGPGLDQPWKSNSYSPSEVVDAIAHARIGTVTQASAPTPAGPAAGH